MHKPRHPLMVRVRGPAPSTDSCVVRPLAFPGGDIDQLAVCGTVNAGRNAGRNAVPNPAAALRSHRTRS
jgi:hypothetical protein